MVQGKKTEKEESRGEARLKLWGWAVKRMGGQCTTEEEGGISKHQKRGFGKPSRT